MTLQANAVVGDNCVLYTSPDGATWTALAAIHSITGNKVTAPKVKTTTVDAAAETSQPGLPDYGEIAAKIRFDKAVTTTILGYMAAKTILYFKVEVDDGGGDVTNSTEVIQGWVMDFDPFGELQENNEVISTLTICCTGAATFTAGSSGS